MNSVLQKDVPVNKSKGGGKQTKKKSPVQLLLQGGIPLILGIIIALLPPPEMLSRAAMIYMGIFVCALIWLVFNVIAEHIVVILAMALFVLFNIADMPTAFSPFASSSVWLVIGAFGISAVVGKSGLLKRVAFSILKLFPENFKGQVLALFTTGLVVSPLIPSLTAKVAILAPFAASVSSSLGFKKGSKGARGLYNAMWLSGGAFGMAFYSGAVPVFTVLGFLAVEEQAKFNWFSWFSMTWVWLVVLVVLSFVMTIVMCKPENAASSANKGFAAAQLKELGPITKNEKLAGLLLALALLGWMTGQWTGIDSGVWSLIILALMAITGLMTSSDFRTKISWESVIFIGGVFALAAQISLLGIHKWLAALMGPFLEPVLGNPYVLIPVLCIATYAIRLVIISQTATTAIFFAIFGSISMAVGVHPVVILFTVYVSSLVWHFSFTNVTYAASLAATGGDMVDHKDNVPMSCVYMVTNLIACTASIPVWQLLGFM